MMVNGNPLHIEEMIGSDGDCSNLERDAANERMATCSCLLIATLGELGNVPPEFQVFQKGGGWEGNFCKQSLQVYVLLTPTPQKNNIKPHKSAGSM